MERLNRSVPSDSAPQIRSRGAPLEAILQRGLVYLALLVLSAVNLFPIGWMLANSFRTEQEIALSPLGLPTQLRFANYAAAWATANLSTYFANSIIICALSVALLTAVGSLAAYCISRFEFRAKRLVYAGFLFGILIPVHATLVPLFIQMKTLGLLNTRWALLFPYVAFNLPTTIYILVSFMSAFPREIEEAAIVDGCGMWRIFWSIVLPMARPALITTVILNFVAIWNEFSFALVLINDNDLKTIPLGMANFAGQYTTNYGAQMAGLTMVLLPTILLYLVVEKYLVQGMTAGAVKG